MLGFGSLPVLTAVPAPWEMSSWGSTAGPGGLHPVAITSGAVGTDVSPFMQGDAVNVPVMGVMPWYHSAGIKQLSPYPF